MTRSLALFLLWPCTWGCERTDDCPAGTEPPVKAVFNCEVADAGDTCGDPSTPKNESLRYPLGCTVRMPYSNPYYPCGGGQPCTCEKNPFPNQQDA